MAWLKKDKKDVEDTFKEVEVPDSAALGVSVVPPKKVATTVAPVEFDERTRTVLDSVGEGVLIFDEKLVVRFANREAQRLIGKVVGIELEAFATDLTPVDSHEEGKEQAKLAPEELPPRVALRDGMPIKKTVAWRVNEETVRYLEVLATPLRIDGVIVGVVAALRNVEQELTLERELREFIAIASHQFRTPLASISWFLEILLSGKVGDLKKEQWEMVQQARESVKRLKDTIRLTLNASTAEFGTMEIKPEPHDIGKLLEEEVRHSGMFAQSRKQTIKLVLPRTMPTMPVDETVFRFIVMNLLSNAMKYSTDGGEILVTATTESGRLLIAVQDQGIGIPSEDQDRIFNKFFRGKNVLMKSDGTGLGLYIVKKLVDRVGGDIWFESEEQKGTTFTVAFPREGFKRVEGRTQLTPLTKSMYGNA